MPTPRLALSPVVDPRIPWRWRYPRNPGVPWPGAGSRRVGASLPVAIERARARHRVAVERGEAEIEVRQRVLRPGFPRGWRHSGARWSERRIELPRATARR